MPIDDLADRSHRLLGRKYRLALWAAIAARDAGEAFTNGELARQVHLTSGEVSKELAVLVSVGLIIEGARAGTKPFHRVESDFWAGCLSLFTDWSRSDGTEGAVIPMR